MISVSQQPLQIIEANLAGLLRSVTQSSAIASAIVSEHIRASLYGTHAADSSQTVHTTRLLSNARRALHLTWPDSFSNPEETAAVDVKDFSTDILDRLRQLGDTWQVGKGQWIATPLRIVMPEASNRCLILGSAPVPLAEQRLGAKISSSGPSRFADTNLIKDRSLAQTVDAWIGSTIPLSDWTTQTIEASAARMEHIGGLAVDELEIYAPDVLRSQRRPNRWIAIGEVSRPLPEVRLCRPQSRYARFNRPYYLVSLVWRDGSLSLQSQASIPHNISLRLRFGLDMRLQTPRRLTIALGESTFTIDKPLQLPDPEGRVFALGWPDRYPDTASERLTFHNDALPIVLHALNRLSVHPVIARRPVT